MDGARFDIEIAAQGIGVDAAADQLNALADRIQQTNTVATKLDTVVAASNKRLEEASKAAQLAKNALSDASSAYAKIEREADSLKKAIEKAQLDEKDTSKLETQLAKKLAAMQKQAAVVDELKAKSDAATAAEEKLKSTTKALEKEQSKAADAAGKAGESFLSIATGGKIESLNRLKESIKGAGGAAKFVLAAGLAFAAAAVFAIAGAAIAGTISLAKFAIAANPGAVMRLNTASMVLQQNLKRLFVGIKLDKFVASVEDMVGMFGEGTATSKALKLVLETLLQPIFDGVAKLQPYVKEMFKGFIVGALDFVIVLLTVRNELYKLIPKSVREALKDLNRNIDWMAVSLVAGKVAAYVLIAALGILAVVLGAVAVLCFTLILPMLILIGIIAAIVYAITHWDEVMTAVKTTVSGWASSIWTAIKGLVDDALTALDKLVPGAKDAAKNVIDGIVNGIKAGAGFVVDALKNLAGDGLGAFKKALGIASPSKAFELQGKYTVAGYVQGLDKGQGDVDDALESMVTPSGGASNAGGGASSSSSSSTSSRSIVIQNLTIGDSPVAQSSWAEFRRMLREEFAGATIEIGGGEAPAT